MSLADWIILAFVGIVFGVTFGIRRYRKKKGKSSCGCSDCSGCAGCDRRNEG